MSVMPRTRELEPAAAGAALSTETAAALVRLQAEIVRHETFDAAAMALVSAIAVEAHCDRVSLGLTKKGVSAVVAISNQPTRPAEGSETRELATLMDEAVEQGLALCVPAARDSGAITLAHSTAARRRNAAICTVPLVVRGETVGAMCFERNGSHPFSADETEVLEHVVSLLAPVLHLMWRDARPWYRRLAESVRPPFARVFGLHDRRSRAIAAGAVLALLVVLVFPVDRQVAGRARVEGVVQRVLVAPTDGFIQATHVRPGDPVKAGQVLAELADKELQLEKRKWSSQLAQFENAYASAVARSDRGLAAINMAKAAEAQANVALAESKLERTQLVAPFDGIVIQGDLTQSIGAPVQQADALMTVARTDGFRVIVEVDERDIRPVQVGQAASVALSALPWSALAAEVTRITPMATTVEGANVFEVETKLLETAPDVRPGLRGVAKVTVGKQPLLFGFVRRVFDWARLWLWTWLG